MMKRLFGAAIALTILATPAAQSYWQSRSQVSVGAAGYAGPGDIATTNVRAWWGLRGYSAAVSAPGTQPAINICDSATGAICTDIVILANGNLDVATATTFAAANCTSSQCPIATIYDQSGASQCNTLASPCDVIQATNANRPLLILSCQGSLPCIRAVSTDRLTTATNHAAISQPYSMSWAARRTANPTAQQFICCTQSGNSPTIGYATSADTLFMSISNGVPFNNSGATENNFHSVQNLFNNTVSHMVIDGVSTAQSLAIGIAWPATLHTLLARDGSGAGALVGDFLELGIWAQDNTANEAALNSNIHAYWGF